MWGVRIVALGVEEDQRVLRPARAVAAQERELERAELHYQRELEVNADFAPAYSNLGNLLERDGRYAELLKMQLEGEDSEQAREHAG